MDSFDDRLNLILRLNLVSKYAGVIDVSASFKEVNNTYTDERCIKFLVDEKLHSDQLLRGNIIPEYIEGYPTDIVSTSLQMVDEPDSLDDADRDEYHEELIGGIRIKNVNRRRSAGGTLGCVVRKKNEIYALTNNHVVFRNIFPREKATMIQSSGTDINKYIIGEATRRKGHSLDAALIKLNDSRKISRNSLLGIEGKVNASISKNLRTENAPVIKSGARTGVTCGLIKGYSPVSKTFEFGPDPKNPAPNNEISRAGDSGSLWIMNDGSMSAVALHAWGDKDFGGKNEWARGIDIQTIINTLKIQFS